MHQFLLLNKLYNYLNNYLTYNYFNKVFCDIFTLKKCSVLNRNNKKYYIK